uniref:ATP-dependent DNA helicase fml1-like n=1 Tax=Diabrotica virgifera virgifera TaxID=50390 RepID=A0A6P7HJ85_DIAVI
MNKNLNNTLSTNLSKDPETEGFDLQAGETWIYPTNYPVREYQYNIVQQALLKNTLVSHTFLITSFSALLVLIILMKEDQYIP